MFSFAVNFDSVGEFCFQALSERYAIQDDACFDSNMLLV